MGKFLLQKTRLHSSSIKLRIFAKFTEKIIHPDSFQIILGPKLDLCWYKNNIQKFSKFVLEPQKRCLKKIFLHWLYFWKNSCRQALHSTGFVIFFCVRNALEHSSEYCNTTSTSPGGHRSVLKPKILKKYFAKKAQKQRA